MNKIYTYARTSTNKQENSIDLQTKALVDFCKIKGFNNAIHLIDEDVSGGKKLLDRQAGSELKNIKRGDILIATKGDRVFRDFVDAVNTVCEWLDNGITLYLLQFNQDPICFENYMTEAMLYQTLLFSHMEKRQIGQRTKDGLKNRRLNGKTNSAEKFGYTNIGKGRDGVEVINEGEQLVVKKIIELRQKYSAQRTANILNIEGIKPKKGTKWYGSSVDNVCKKNIANTIH